MIFLNLIPKSSQFFLKFMIKHKRNLFFITLLNIISIFFNIIEPLLAKKIIDISFSIDNLEEILFPAIYWSIIVVIRYIIQYISQKLSLNYNIKVYREIRLFIFNNILQKSLSFFQKNPSSYLISKCNTDIIGLNGMMLSNLITGTLALIEILIMVILMLQISVLLTFISIILECAILYIQFAFPLKQMYREHNEYLAKMDKTTQDIFNCIKLVKSAHSYRKEENYFKKDLNLYLNKKYTRDNFDIIRSTITAFFSNFIYPGIIITGGIFIYYHMITIGAVMAFIMYFQKVNSLFNSAFAMVPLLRMATVSAERLYDIIQYENEKHDILSRRLKISEPIIFKNIYLNYDSKKILHNLSLTLYPHKINAVVGRSGAGKSTIVNLLMGFIKSNSGHIYINGKDISQYNIQDIRKDISLLSQESILFQRSIRENIDYHLTNECGFNEKTVYPKLIESLEKAQALRIIEKLPKGLDSLLTANATNLSGGEKQRLCLARELLKDADICIFDESTSALDALSENMILNTIREIVKSHTVLMITHKLKNIKMADIIYVIDKGTVCEQGTHSELMDKKGIYYNLYLEQEKE